MRISGFAWALCLMFVVGAMGASQAVTSQARADILPTEEALAERMLGDPNAPVEMIEYVSMTCPHCADFHNDKLPALKEKYIETGKVKLIVRDFPFDRLGAMAAMMARCGNPDRYFQFVDVLFKQQRSWTRSEDPVGALMKIGQLGGLSPDDFTACMDNEALLNGILEQRIQASEEFEVNSTPTFIINGEKIAGNQSMETFEAAIEKHLD